MPAPDARRADFRVVADAPGTVAVSGALNFANATSLLEALRAAFRHGDRQMLDLAAVESCDSAGLACVLAALSEADQHGRRVAAQHIPDGMRALAQVCDVERLLR